MRYEDWDILLFPGDSGIPLKEFKVACHVVHDAEFSHVHGSGGLPTVCAFVPSLPTGAPFKISIHAWKDPPVSLYTKSYSKYAEEVKFEARLFIDGRLVASTTLEPMTEGPYIIAQSFNFSKGGELECLKFPPFRKELLQQSLWSPADDLGRIKLVISEGFPRDSLSMPIERVKNIVSFSFQHAPLDVLESSGIAWPNADMWRRAPFASSMPVPAYHAEDVDSHAHSPRRQTGRSRGIASGLPVQESQATDHRPKMSCGTRRATHPACASLPPGKNASSEPFGEANSYLEWLSGMSMGAEDQTRGQGCPPDSRRTSSDTTMPDYTPLDCGEQGLGLAADRPVVVAGLRQDDDEGHGHLKVPTNTPTTSGQSNHDAEGVPIPFLSQNSQIPFDFANSLTNSLLNQPMPLHFQQPGFGTPSAEVRSRKENRRQQTTRQSPSMLPPALSLGQEHQDMRRVSQQMYVAASASVPVGLAGSRTISPQHRDSREVSQRAASYAGGPVASGQAFTGEATLGVPTGTGPGFDKGTKRSRNFTPVSARAVDEEDEPRRCSPSLRLTPLAGEVRTKRERE